MSLECGGTLDLAFVFMVFPGESSQFMELEARLNKHVSPAAPAWNSLTNHIPASLGAVWWLKFT